MRSLVGLLIVVLLTSAGFVAPAAAQCNMMECCDPSTGRCCNNAGQCWQNGLAAHAHHRGQQHAAAPKMSPAPKGKTQYLRYQ